MESMLKNRTLYTHSKDQIKDGLMGKYLKLGQVAAMLGISRGSIYRYIAEKKLAAKMDEFGDRIEFKFDPEEVNRFGTMIKKRRRTGQRLI